MLGSLRLILAIAVAASHAGFRIAGLNPGVIAVVGFYLISGYVMAGLIRRHYSQPATAPAFYLDRALRLFPQYFTYLGLALAWQLYTQTENYHLSHPPTAADFINNILIVPLNYYMWNGSDRYTLIPPAWSLGAEIQFYLVAPFLLIWPKRLLVVGLLSLGVYLGALGGLINSDWYGYRLLPGVLFFFLLGALIQHHHQHPQPARAAAIAALAALAATAALGALQYHGTLRQPYHAETLLGLIIGIAFLHTLAPRPRTRWDDLAGDLSYGVFLNHFLILWLLYPQGARLDQIPALLAISTALAWLTHRTIERPLLKWRQTLRSRPKN
jgi:peptidoglycan/LPS O-acetylase OafA/YrhL